MDKNTKIDADIKKDGKTLKYMRSELRARNVGRVYDIYTDENGKLYEKERPSSIIKYTDFRRDSAANYIICFERTLKSSLLDAVANNDEKELDRHLLQCAHPLQKAKAYFEKEDAENANQNFVNAVQDKIVQTCEELSQQYGAENILSALESLLEMPRLKENPPFHNAIFLQVYKMKNPEIEKDEKEM